MTKNDVLQRAQAAYAELAECSEHAADEAREQAGLPVVWAWDMLTLMDARRLSVACRIRLLELAP